MVHICSTPYVSPDEAHFLCSYMLRYDVKPASLISQGAIVLTPISILENLEQILFVCHPWVLL